MTESTHANQPQPARSPDGVPMVEAIGVHKAYGRLEVLKGIDLTVQRGEVLCLIGPSGSGKSTFLHHLLNWQAAVCLKEDENIKPVPGIDPDLTPLLITLRELAPRLEDWSGLPEKERKAKLLAALRKQVEAELKALGGGAAEYLPHLMKELGTNACLLAFDGLDEEDFCMSHVGFG